MAELYLGLMSGTSLDAMDGVLADFSQTPPQIIANDSIPIKDELRKRLHPFNYDDNCSLWQLAKIDTELSALAAELVVQLLKKEDIHANQVRALCFAGQTLAHKKGFSWQAGDPNVLAEKTGISVVADLRRRDLAAGGQGAPLAAAFHRAFFAHPKKNRAIVNLGGIANVTQLNQGTAVGFDVGPGNCLLDEWANTHLGTRYDNNGEWGKSGTPITKLLTAMLQDSYFSQRPPKSTGRDYFNINWVKNYLEQSNQEHRPEDIQATLVDLTVLSICLAVCEELTATTNIYLCGGGVKNAYLCGRMRQLAKGKVATTQELGVSPESMEALSFAWLAYRTMHKWSGNLPSVTGAKGERVLGGIYLGGTPRPS